MKLVHLGDLHLGKSLLDFDLIEDQRYILDRIMEIIERKAADAVLLAGDIYDKAVPSEAAVNLLDDFLSRLARLGVSIYMISGNHDSDDRLNYGSKLFESNSIYISSVYDGTLHRHVMKDEHGEAYVYLLPFVKASQVKHFFPDEKIDSYEDAVRVILDNAGIDKDARNVLVAHQFVTGRSQAAGSSSTAGSSVSIFGGKTYSEGEEIVHHETQGGDSAIEDCDLVLAGSESLGVRNVGNVEKIGADCFDMFDYVALGHIHSPQRVGREEVRYSGSPLKYSLSEVGSRKSVPVVTLGEKGDVALELVPLVPMRDMRHIRGGLKELIDKKYVRSPEDFIYATLTDEEIVNDAMGILQRTYPNTVKVDFDNSHTRAIEQVDISRIAENKSFSELISEFYQLVYGCGISDAEMDMMREAAKEAGVIHETD